MDVQAWFSVVLKVSEVVKWNLIFVRSIRAGFAKFSRDPNYEPTKLALTRVHDI